MNFDSVIGRFADPYFANAPASSLAEITMLLISIVVAAVLPAIFFKLALNGGKYAPVFGMTTVLSFFGCFFLALNIASYPYRWNAQFKECQEIEVQVNYKGTTITQSAVECKSRSSIDAQWSDWQFDSFVVEKSETKH